MPIFTCPMRQECTPSYQTPYYIHPLLEALSAPPSRSPQTASSPSSSSKRAPSSASANPSPRPHHAARPAPTPRNHNRSNRAFRPNFDVYESNDAYILEGDLPGVSDKKSIDIEFADEKTLLIRGRVDRTPSPAPAVATTTTTTSSNAATETTTTEKSEAGTGTRRRSLNPTVEDTDDEDDFTMVRTPSSSSLASSHAMEVDGAGVKKPAKEEAAAREPPRKKILLSERTFGSYQRSFEFQLPVEPDKVTATLEDGLLRIVVPKVEFKGARKIDVQVL